MHRVIIYKNKINRLSSRFSYHVIKHFFVAGRQYCIYFIIIKPGKESNYYICNV